MSKVPFRSLVHTAAELMFREKYNLQEGKNYHSIFVKSKNGSWQHHFDADSHADAREEMDSLKNGGEKSKKFVVPKSEAKWNKMNAEDIHNFVLKRLQQKNTVQDE